MHRSIEIVFAEKKPNYNQIIGKLKEVTGLNFEVEYTPSQALIINHPDFKQFQFVIIPLRDTNTIIVSTGQYHVWYLLEATLAVLTLLGGKSSTPFSEDGYRKWDEVKNTYQVKKLIDWDGKWPDEEHNHKKTDSDFKDSIK